MELNFKQAALAAVAPATASSSLGSASLKQCSVFQEDANNCTEAELPGAEAEKKSSAGCEGRLNSHCDVV